MKTLLLLIALTGLCAVTGCGGHQTPLGRLSDHDISSIRAVSADMRTFSSSYTRLIAAMTRSDIPSCRKAVDTMEEAVSRASDKSLDIDSAGQRATMQRYLDRMRGVAIAADRLIGYYEDPSAPDAGVENDLIDRFQQAALAARRADEALLNEMLDHATPEQRKQLRALYQRANARFQKATGD
jgi:hypothetical protein